MSFNERIRSNICNALSCVCDLHTLTLSSTLGPMRLTKRQKASSTETLVAALCVFTLLRTCPILLTLIHICHTNSGKCRTKLLCLNTVTDPWCLVYLHRCAFQWIWVCNQACRSIGSLLLSGRYSCVHKCWHCMCARCLGLKHVDI